MDISSFWVAPQLWAQSWSQNGCILCWDEPPATKRAVFWVLMRREDKGQIFPMKKPHICRLHIGIFNPFTHLTHSILGQMCILEKCKALQYGVTQSCSVNHDRPTRQPSISCWVPGWYLGQRRYNNLHNLIISSSGSSAAH